MVNCVNYSEKAFLQLLKSNPKYQQIIAKAKDWQNVINVIDKLGLIYTEKQINYVKLKQWY